MPLKILDATPEKRIFLSIIAEYDLKLSVCELIDNAIDIWTKGRRKKLGVSVDFDIRQQTISISDDAGGIQEENLDQIVSPGKTSNAISDDVIGYFGVGSKRAVVALAQDITIHSRFRRNATFTVKFDEDWIDENADWNLPYVQAVRPLPVGTTLIELSKLRVPVTENDIEHLKIHLGQVYANFLERGLEIKVNGDNVKSQGFEKEWSYPAFFSPMEFYGTLKVEDRDVEVSIVSGLLNHPGDPDDSYGVFLYCNDRLIVRAVRDFSVGFVPGLVGNPHYNVSLVRTVVKLRGQSRDMPWDSSKSGINTKHDVYLGLRQAIIDSTKGFAQVSRSLQGTWDDAVFPYKSGRVKKKQLESLEHIPKRYLPSPPPSKKSWGQRIRVDNETILDEKPWVEGLLDSILAVDLIFKQSLSQKNRICLILLDSTVEISYKEYLVKEVRIGVAKLRKIIENRADVQNEVIGTLTVSATTLMKINHFYQLRCDLIHNRSTPNVTDDQVIEYREIVENLLGEMFGLNFL